jgi:isoleucyl-tRNA synthetase
VYFEILKDRLYTGASRPRRSGQAALYKIHYALTRLVAPLMSFTAEEVWSHTVKPAGAPDSVHIAMLPDPAELDSGLSGAQLAAWDQLMDLREPALKALEEARAAKRIGSALEARLRITAGAHSILVERASELPALFVVSQVSVEPGGSFHIAVERAEGAKCERCWKYSTAVGQDAEYPTVCDACSAALREQP